MASSDGINWLADIVSALFPNPTIRNVIFFVAGIMFVVGYVVTMSAKARRFVYRARVRDVKRKELDDGLMFYSCFITDAEVEEIIVEYLREGINRADFEGYKYGPQYVRVIRYICVTWWEWCCTKFR